MTQGVPVSGAPNIPSMVASISTLETQQNILENMIDGLEAILFGTGGAKAVEPNKSEGIESRLNILTNAKEIALNRLDRILCRLNQ